MPAVGGSSSSEKVCRPSGSAGILGFELDTNQMVIRLPEDKLHHTQSTVRDWLGKKACKKRDLESLLGHLQHAATVVRLGRTFVRRLIELVSTVQMQDRWIHLSSSTRSDLNWWFVFMERWNGVSMVPMPAIPLETDASGSWGCRAHWGSWWLQWKWEGPSIEWPISPKELLPILFAVVVWGEHWRGGGWLVECHCDNMAVVAVVNSSWSQDNTLMYLLRCLFFMVAHFQVHI